MPLTPMAGGAASLYPYFIHSAATLTAITSPDALPAVCTISLWVDNGTGYEHLHIARNGSAVAITVNNNGGIAYSGTIGATYADLLKNILGWRYGTWSGLTLAELHCADQAVGPEVFGQYSPADGSRWVPRLVEIPSYLPAPVWTMGGTASANSTMGALVPSLAFNGNPAIGNGWVSNQAATNQWLLYDYGEGNAKIVTYYTLYGWRNSPNRSPYNWALQGSNDDSEFVSLHTSSGVDPTNGVSFTVTNAIAYRFYRLYIYSSYGESPGVQELMLYVQGDSETYGPQGAYLDFALAADLGNDLSGNSNDWTVTGTRTTKTPTN